MLIRSKWMLAVILAVFILLSLSCAPTAAPDDPDPDENDVDVEPEPDPVEEPDEPFRITVAATLDVESWDPPVGWNVGPQMITDNAYDWLFLRAGDGSGWVPSLAREWETIDEVTVRFYLEEGVKFHDGTELTAEDVKFHYERIRDGERDVYIVQPQYTWIEDIVIHDPYTFDVVAVEPDSAFMFRLAQTNTGAGIVSKAYVEAFGQEAVHRSPMGTGAWIRKDWVRDEHVLFEVNPDYWAGPPDYDEFMFRIIPEASTRVAELLTGGIDMTYGVMQTDQARIDADPDTRTLWSPTDRGSMLWLRQGVHPNWVGEPELDREFTTEDPRVRKAIELAIDKYAIRDLEGGTGEAFRARGPYQPLPQGNPDLYGPHACLHDPDRAKELLQEAGYGPGEATLVFDASEAHPTGDYARVITNMLEEVGFDVDLRLHDTATHTSEVYYPRKTQELILLGLGGQMNPVFATRIFLQSEQLVNYGGQGAGSEELDELLHKAWTEMQDVDLRNQYFHEATQIIADERYVIGLFQQSQLWGLSSRVEYTPRFDILILGTDITPVR